MNISPLTILIWQKLDVLQTILLISCPFLGIFSLVYILTNFLYSKESLEEEIGYVKFRSIGKKFVFAFAASALALLLVPNSKAFAMMVVIPKILDSEVVSKDLPEVYDLAIESLKSSLKEKEKGSDQK